MTSVFLERDGDLYTVHCRRHAETEAACSAVSTLCYTLAGYLHNIDAVILDEKLEPGDARICFKDKSAEARAAFDMTSIGFLQLAGSYPESCSVEMQEIE